MFSKMFCWAASVRRNSRASCREREGKGSVRRFRVVQAGCSSLITSPASIRTSRTRAAPRPRARLHPRLPLLLPFLPSPSPDSRSEPNAPSKSSPTPKPWHKTASVRHCRTWGSPLSEQRGGSHASGSRCRGPRLRGRRGASSCRLRVSTSFVASELGKARVRGTERGRRRRRAGPVMTQASSPTLSGERCTRGACCASRVKRRRSSSAPTACAGRRRALSHRRRNLSSRLASLTAVLTRSGARLTC